MGSSDAADVTIRSAGEGDIGAIQALFAESMEARDIAFFEIPAVFSSDNTWFLQAGIPNGGLFTGAGEPWDPCYHQACDGLDNVDADLLTEMTVTAAHAVQGLAEREE